MNTIKVSKRTATISTAGILFAVLSMTLFSIPSSAQSPGFINYRGHLVDSEGLPVPSGSYVVDFGIWTSLVPSEGERLVWSSRYQVFAQDGVFSVMLGADGLPHVPAVTPETQTLSEAFNEPDRFLSFDFVEAPEGIDVSSLNVPRQQIVSAPFAIRANNGIPVGGIIPWVPLDASANVNTVSGSIPAGFRLCTGPDAQDDPSTAFDETRIPDLRDRFIKGVDETQTALSEGGSHKNNHNHSGTTGGANNAGPSQGAAAPYNNGVVLPQSGHGHGFTTGSNNDAQTAYSNAPAFVSLFFIIRVK